MPYVVDYDTFLHRPAKRRRLTVDLRMARRKSIDQHPSDDERDGKTLYDIDQVAGEQDVQAISNIERRERMVQEIRTSSREELIECIKRGERPTFVPSANLQALQDEEVSSRRQSQAGGNHGVPPEESAQVIEDPFFGTWTEARSGRTNPRSAFHRGDFNGQDAAGSSVAELDIEIPSPISPTSLSDASPPPWLRSTASSPIGKAFSDSRLLQGMVMSPINRRRTPSLGSSLSSSFVLRTPTSPLVYAVNNSTPEISSTSTISLGGTGRDRASRRRTMPPNAFHSLGAVSADATPPNFSRPLPSSARDASMHHSFHQPRRSLSSFTYQPTPVPQDASNRTRRLSLASDSSHRRRTSMVGSFEESILRGRMSSPASQPFDFVAQIGVMGKGDCPSNLKCPAHVSIPFQAVFYHYPSASPYDRATSIDAPSPYVGTIDLEHRLKPVLLSTKQKKATPLKTNSPMINDDPRAPENTPIGKALAREAEMQHRRQRSTSPRISLGGAYRVPQKGQVQIIIKNQNKTAVKLFLIPYDLTDMEAGTKTFVRQRSYSCGPILEGSLDSTSGSASIRDPLRDKSILRYLIHIRFCCPAKGKYYLNDHIKVVFANRVPDGKEKLKNEMQLPEPKYSPFNPLHSRRKTSQYSVESSPRQSARSIYSFTPVEEPQITELIFSDESSSKETALLRTSGAKSSDQIVESRKFPIQLAARDKISQPAHARAEVSAIIETERPFSFLPSTQQTLSTSPSRTQALSPVQGFLPSTSTRSSPVPWGSSSTSSTTRSFSPAPLEIGNGLLSQQFRTLYGNNRAGSVSPEVRRNEGAAPHGQADPKEESVLTEEHSEQGDISLVDRL